MSSQGSTNAKQESTMSQLFRIPSSIAANEVESKVRTVITHNKGGKWESLKAPTTTSKGKVIDCYEEEGCTLNLELFSTGGAHAPAYSSASAVGVVIGTGNVGSTLTDNQVQKALYISRDGGLNFKSTHSGNYIYDIGDHGALIIAAKMNEPTTEVEFTWDYGKTWDKVKVSDSPMLVKNIITEPKSVSQQFLVYGTTVVSEEEDGDDS